MTAELRDFYVYVYVDPRNYEEFYYGKGKGARRIAHLSDETDSEKVARINAIRKEGLDPIVRTIAAGLTEQEALLIETTLIWKLGKNLTNLASGHFVSLFRPHNTLHKELPSFDFQNGIYLVNVGEGPTRNGVNLAVPYAMVLGWRVLGSRSWGWARTGCRVRSLWGC